MKAAFIEDITVNIAQHAKGGLGKRSCWCKAAFIENMPVNTAQHAKGVLRLTVILA